MIINCETHKNKEATRVCHHCGKLLCEVEDLLASAKSKTPLVTKDKLCGYKVPDFAFAVPEDQPKVLAIHCEACLMEHHSEYSQSLARLKSNI